MWNYSPWADWLTAWGGCLGLLAGLYLLGTALQGLVQGQLGQSRFWRGVGLPRNEGEIALRTCLGAWAGVTLFAAWRTGGETILLASTPWLLVGLWRHRRYPADFKLIELHGQASSNAPGAHPTPADPRAALGLWLRVLLALSLMVLLYLLRTTRQDGYTFRMLHIDYATFALLADTLLAGNRENLQMVHAALEPNWYGPQPYNYFHLWTYGLFSRVLGLPSGWAANLLAPAVFCCLKLLLFVQLLRGVGLRPAWALLVGALSFWTWPFWLSWALQWELPLSEGFFVYRLHLLQYFQPKYLPQHLVGLLAAWALQQRRYWLVLWLLALPVVLTVAGATYWTLLVLLAGGLLAGRRMRPGQLAPIGLALLGIALWFVGFYGLLPRFTPGPPEFLQGLNDVPLSLDPYPLRTMVNILGRTVLELLIMFLPVEVPLLALLLFSSGETRWRLLLALRPVLALGGVLLLGGLISWWVVYPLSHYEAYQMYLQLVHGFLLLAVYGCVLALSRGKLQLGARRLWAGLGLAVLAYGVWFGVREFVHPYQRSPQHFEARLDVDFFEELQRIQPHSAYGGLIATPGDILARHPGFVNYRTFTYLYWPMLPQFTATLQVYHDNPAYLDSMPQFSETEQALNHQMPIDFYQAWFQHTYPDSSLSQNELVTSMVDHYQLSWLLVTPSAQVPPQLLARVVETLHDRAEGYRMLFLDRRPLRLPPSRP